MRNDRYQSICNGQQTVTRDQFVGHMLDASFSACLLRLIRGLTWLSGLGLKSTAMPGGEILRNFRNATLRTATAPQPMRVAVRVARSS